MALKTNDAGSWLYIRVELPRVHGKYRAQFDLVQYVNHPVTGDKAEVGRETMECDYDLNGANVIEQCYFYAKAKVPFGVLDC
ncbi:hypothetical protein [Escherichia coli]|uniref:hypothetical protein n=1 Tax=Escherichia coli TaxID=562 RepID=UPI001C6FD047|nr:hypothetical protein [Escherichia coli]MBW9582497.1 hypothetical protein [Escherichia coli]